MLEIVSRIVGHSQLLHHPPRTNVCVRSKGDNGAQAQLFKAVAECFPRAFGGQSPAPILSCQPPANFNGGHKRRFKPGDGKTDEAKKGAVLPQLRREKAETVALEMRFSVIHSSVGSLRRQQPRHELHHPWVGIERAKRLPVRGSPAAQQKPFGCEAYPHVRQAIIRKRAGTGI